MSDDTVRVKYIGAEDGFSEVGITGRQQRWNRGQTGFVTTAIAALLAASGKFDSDEELTVKAKRNLLTGGVSFSVGGFAGASTLVQVGDSILGQCYTVEGYAPGGCDPATVSGSFCPYSRARGIVPVLNALLGQPFRVVYAGAITGTTTNTILASSAAAFNRQIDVVVEDGGTNDISLYETEWGTLTAAENGIVANRKKLWAAAIAKGAKLIIALGIPPVGATAAWTAAQVQTACRANRRLADAADSLGYVRFIDLSEPLIDPTSANGYFKADVSDGNKHPTQYGAYLVAKKIAADKVVASYARQRMMLSSQMDCIQQDASSRNLLNATVGLGTGSTGSASGTGMTGTIMAGITASRYNGSGASIAASVVTAPNGIGKAQRFVITGALASDQLRAVILPGINISQFPAGSWGYFECMVTVSSGSTPGSGAPTGLTAVSINAGTQFSGSTIVPGGQLNSFGLGASTSETGAGYGAETLTLVSEPVWLPSDVSALTFIKAELYATFGASGNATVDMYQMRWIKLP